MSSPSFYFFIKNKQVAKHNSRINLTKSPVIKNSSKLITPNASTMNSTINQGKFQLLDRKEVRRSTSRKIISSNVDNLMLHQKGPYCRFYPKEINLNQRLNPHVSNLSLLNPFKGSYIQIEKPKLSKTSNIVDLIKYKQSNNNLSLEKGKKKYTLMRNKSSPNIRNLNLSSNDFSTTHKRHYINNFNNCSNPYPRARSNGKKLYDQKNFSSFSGAGVINDLASYGGEFLNNKSYIDYVHSRHRSFTPIYNIGSKFVGYTAN